MFAAQWGWWLAVPDGYTKSRTEEHQCFDLPELPVGETLHYHWQEMGLCGSGGAGPVPLPWTEIDAYARLTGSRFPSEAWKTIRLMSERFVECLQDRHPLSMEPMDREGNG